jgi:hypothetical protein
MAQVNPLTSFIEFKPLPWPVPEEDPLATEETEESSEPSQPRHPCQLPWALQRFSDSGSRHLPVLVTDDSNVPPPQAGGSKDSSAAVPPQQLLAYAPRFHLKQCTFDSRWAAPARHIFARWEFAAAHAHMPMSPHTSCMREYRGFSHSSSCKCLCGILFHDSSSSSIVQCQFSSACRALQAISALQA